MAQATIVTAPAETGSRRRVERWFYISAGLFMILVSVAGFGPSIIDQSRRNAPPTPLVIAHGILIFAWEIVIGVAVVPAVAWREFATWLVG